MANTSNLDLVKPAGTDHALISVINSNMDKVDAYAGKVNTSLAGVEDGLAIVATGNTHAAITAGQFVYVKEHNTLPEGLYTASSNIAANATLSTTNLTADSKGGLNALSEQIAKYDFAEVNGTITNTDGSGKNTKFSYPTGFTKDNSLVVASFTSNDNGNSWYPLVGSDYCYMTNYIYIYDDSGNKTGRKYRVMLMKIVS